MKVCVALLCLILALCAIRCEAATAHITIGPLMPLKASSGCDYYVWLFFSAASGRAPMNIGKVVPAASTSMVDATITFTMPYDSQGILRPESARLVIGNAATTTPGNSIVAAASFIGVNPDANGDVMAAISFDSTDACGASFPTGEAVFIVWTYSESVLGNNAPCGIWFLNVTGQTVLPSDASFVNRPGLMIPDLPGSTAAPGFKYEGWIISPSLPGDTFGTVSLGKFEKYYTSPGCPCMYADYADEDGPGAGAGASVTCCGAFPNVPGQEWVLNPLNVYNAGPAPYNLYITLEPEPDDDPLKPWGYRPYKALDRKSVV